MYGIKSFFKISEAQLAFLQAEQSFERVKQKKLAGAGGLENFMRVQLNASLQTRVI
jgi:hypothetical protein